MLSNANHREGSNKGRVRSSAAAGADSPANAMCDEPAALKPGAVYSATLPSDGIPMAEHFSSLLLSGDLHLTFLELALLLALSCAALLPGDFIDGPPGSMSFVDMVTFMWATAVVRRLYNTYLEAVYFTFPQYRTQPPHEHSLKKQRKDLMGREQEQLDRLVWHDKMTMVSQVALEIALYYGIAGYFPAPDRIDPLHIRVGKLFTNHYVLSFAMYWMHRSLHVVPFLWKHIHSVHHFAKHPLSRNTYEDHWLDNLGNAIVGHACAQILVPLDRTTFIVSHMLRIFESLEKHSGVSCHYNLAHSVQFWLPYAQMPHHHDWHHEGHKGSNYTFTSMGGIWDYTFGTRKAGRAMRNPGSATAQDIEDTKSQQTKSRAKTILDHPMICTIPVVLVLAAATFKLRCANFAL